MAEAQAPRTLRHRLHHALEGRSRDGKLSTLDRVLTAAIVVAVVAAVLETEPTLSSGHAGVFRALSSGWG